MKKLSTQQRQQQIIDAAINIIKDGGIQSLTMQKIATRVGISEQAVYRHFSGKQEILISIIQYFDVCCSDMDCQNHDNTGECAVLKILAMSTNHLTYFAENPAVASVIFSEEIFQNDQILAAAVKKALDKRLTKMTRLLQKGQNNGEFNNRTEPEHMAHMLLGSMRLLVTRWRLSGFSFDIVEAGKGLISDILSLFQTNVNIETEASLLSKY